MTDRGSRCNGGPGEKCIWEQGGGKDRIWDRFQNWKESSRSSVAFNLVGTLVSVISLEEILWYH